MTPADTHLTRQIEALIAAVLPHALNYDSALHGPDHWRRVARFGRRTAQGDVSISSESGVAVAPMLDRPSGRDGG